MTLRRILAYWGLTLLACGLFAATGCKQQVTDTGYLGTWERELSDDRISRIALWEEDGKTYFCWSTLGSGRGDRVRCAPGGVSETVVRREVIYEHRFTVRAGDVEGELFIDVDGVPRNDRTTPIKWTDRLVVQPGGMELLTYKVSLNGQTRNIDRNPIRFYKVADVPL